MGDPFLRYPDVVATLGISRSTIERMVRSGELPRPRRIGKRAVAWPSSQIEQWKNERPIAETG